MAAVDVSPLLHQFSIPQGFTWRPLVSPGGLSGSRLWRVSAGGDELLLRCWPEGTTRSRVEAISWLLFQLRTEGLEIVPLPIHIRHRSGGSDWAISHDGSFWTLQQWRPGEASGERPPPRPQLAAGLQALARFHLAAVACQEGQQLCETEFARQGAGHAPGLRSRVQLAESYLRHGLAQLQSASVPAVLHELQSRRASLLPLFREVAPRLLAQCGPALSWRVPLQPCLRDVREEHVLFTGDEVTGLIDFDAVRIDSVATDLARLLGDYVQDNAELWQFGLDAYHAVRPLSPPERALVQHYDRFAVLLTGMQWLDWMLLEGKEFDLSQVLPRLDATLFRLEHLRGDLRTSGGIVF